MKKIKINQKSLIITITLILFFLSIFHYRFHYYNMVKRDDAYITFRYARNLSESGQLSYNLGEKVFGTTTPLWAILLGLFNKLSFNIEHIAVYLSILFLFFSILFIFNKYQMDYKNYFFLIYFIFLLNPNSLHILFQGMETYFCIFLLTIGFLFIKDIKIKIIFSLFVLNARIDMGIFYLASICLYLLIIKYFSKDQVRLKFLLNIIGLILLVAIIYFGMNILTFGQMIPNTIIAKSAIYSGTHLEQSLLNRVLSTLKLNFGGYSALFLWIIYFISLYVFIKNSKKTYILVLDFFVFFNMFSLIFLITRHQSWYYPPLMFFFITAIILHFINSDIGFIKYKNLIKTSFIILILMFTIYQSYGYYRIRFNNRQLLIDTDLYKVAKIIEPNSTIFCGDIGIIGYFSNNCYIYDYAGLVTPQAIKYNKRKMIYKDNKMTTSFNSILEQIKKVNPNYVNIRKVYAITDHIVKNLVRSNSYKIKLNSTEILLEKISN